MRRTDDDAQRRAEPVHRPRDDGVQLTCHALTGRCAGDAYGDQRLVARQQ